ncbi:MAG: Carbohydrate kinase, FGGY family, partial [uncultured Rubrobacteraceae bacterium]
EDAAAGPEGPRPDIRPHLEPRPRPPLQGNARSDRLRRPAYL